MSYNSKNDRYGLLISDLWEIDGFHCGETMEVFIDDEWKPTRMEMAHENSGHYWYLVDTPFKDNDLEGLKIRVL